MRSDRPKSDDDRLIERIGAAYAPPPLLPSRRVALEKELWARIESGRRLSGFRPLAAAVTFAAAVLWFAPAWHRQDSEPIDTWEYDVLYSADGASATLQVAADDEPLPEEYRAIEVLLAGG